MELCRASSYDIPAAGSSTGPVQIMKAVFSGLLGAWLGCSKYDFVAHVLKQSRVLTEMQAALGWNTGWLHHVSHVSWVMSNLPASAATVLNLNLEFNPMVHATSLNVPACLSMPDALQCCTPLLTSMCSFCHLTCLTLTWRFNFFLYKTVQSPSQTCLAKRPAVNELGARYQRNNNAELLANSWLARLSIKHAKHVHCLQFYAWCVSCHARLQFRTAMLCQAISNPRRSCTFEKFWLLCT